jgi:hypothetical protein
LDRNKLLRNRQIALALNCRARPWKQSSSQPAHPDKPPPGETVTVIRSQTTGDTANTAVGVLHAYPGRFYSVKLQGLESVHRTTDKEAESSPKRRGNDERHYRSRINPGLENSIGR